VNQDALLVKNLEPVEAPSGLLERTLGVLELLAANAHGLLLFEIADSLHIPRSATHRVLSSLIEHGYVRQEREQGAYQLTAKIASLAFTFLAGSGITDFAQPLLDRLARESSELVRLAMIDGRELIWVAKAQGSQHGLPDDEARALVEKQGYGLRKDYGPRAPENWPALLKFLRQTRKRGVSICIQTYTPWMSSTAAPIRHPKTREVTGAVVIAGPDIRLTEERMLQLAPALLQTAQELSMAALASPGLRSARQRGSFFDASAS
jgi:IclR family transcriptional regulator, acetate operon repressor